MTDTPTVDDRTFRIVLREPYPMMLEALGKIGTSAPYIMRRREAETDPGQQVRETIGSGPFTYNRDLSRPARPMCTTGTRTTGRAPSRPRSPPAARW